MFKNWFKKEKVEVADLESIELTPEVTLPEPTRRELYDAAVSEVQQARVRELIYRELMKMSIDPEVYEQTMLAIDKYGAGHTGSGDVKRILTEYPKAYFYDSRYPDVALELRLPEVTLVHLADTLATNYLSE